MTRNVIICGDIKRWTKTKKHYKIRRGDFYEGGIKMATTNSGKHQTIW